MKNVQKLIVSKGFLQALLLICLIVFITAVIFAEIDNKTTVMVDGFIKSGVFQISAAAIALLAILHTQDRFDKRLRIQLEHEEDLKVSEEARKKLLESISKLESACLKYGEISLQRDFSLETSAKINAAYSEIVIGATFLKQVVRFYFPECIDDYNSVEIPTGKISPDQMTDFFTRVNELVDNITFKYPEDFERVY